MTYDGYVSPAAAAVEIGLAVLLNYFDSADGELFPTQKSVFGLSFTILKNEKIYVVTSQSDAKNGIVQLFLNSAVT